jgi:FAD/FMN-containing dehydrogenase
MLPRITPDSTLKNIYADFIRKLRETVFAGDIRTDYAARLAVATDNSIYQVIPQAVLNPRNMQDIVIALTIAQEAHYREHIKFAPRGGGTATNGQSLTAGIIID